MVRAPNLPSTSPSPPSPPPSLLLLLPTSSSRLTTSSSKLITKRNYQNNEIINNSCLEEEKKFKNLTLKQKPIRITRNSTFTAPASPRKHFKTTKYNIPQKQEKDQQIIGHHQSRCFSSKQYQKYPYNNSNINSNKYNFSNFSKLYRNRGVHNSNNNKSNYNLKNNRVKIHLGEIIMSEDNEKPENLNSNLEIHLHHHHEQSDESEVKKSFDEIDYITTSIEENESSDEVTENERIEMNSTILLENNNSVSISSSKESEMTSNMNDNDEDCFEENSENEESLDDFSNRNAKNTTMETVTISNLSVSDENIINDNINSGGGFINGINQNNSNNNNISGNNNDITNKSHNIATNNGSEDALKGTVSSSASVTAMKTTTTITAGNSSIATSKLCSAPQGGSSSQHNYNASNASNTVVTVTVAQPGLQIPLPVHSAPATLQHVQTTGTSLTPCGGIVVTNTSLPVSGIGSTQSGAPQQIQVQASGPTPVATGCPAGGNHHPTAPPPPHHHIFPVHVIQIPQAPPGTGPATAVTGAWPIVETPIYVDSNGEARPFCPAHPQGPGPREHRVLLQLDAGVSLPLQIAGKRKVFRGPTTVQMVSQNRPPPIPVPVQVPQGQVMQQFVNESGALTHVVLSPTQYQQIQGQGGVPHIHAPFITANGTTSHFYSPLATAFPGPGGGPHFHHITPSGHLQPQQMSHSPHSPSPPNNYHKDERSQRQHTKLLRKLDQKREINSAMSTPAHSPSPRKNDINGLRRTSRNGASSVGTSEDGEESSSVPDEEDDCQTIIEQLSAVQKPEVSEITPRTAMLRWEAPPLSENLINSRDLRYEVLLSDRGKEGKYKIIFKGESYVCLIQDLRPGQEYFVCLQVHFEKLQGSASEPTVFKTPSCEPDQPMPPKLITRTKNSLQLRWTAPVDNGSHIIHYILEYDEGKGKGFAEIVKTKGKQYTLGKLQPSTPYSFRLLAVNECGPSLYSNVISFSTCGNPPLAPKPPILQSSTCHSLRVSWERRSQDEEFTLQMADRDSGIFLNMYNGLDTMYECKGLKRATSYQFRLRADNEAGSSPWSSDVTYKTQPERPGKPSKPQVKGKIHGTHFKVKWDAPVDKGGAEIRKYFLEISSGAKFERIYSGSEPESTCDRLSPGTTYQVRVSCEGPAGVSPYSDLCTVTTEAVVPGAPDPPFCDNPPGPFAAVLRWDKPDYNGGAPVIEYELQLDGTNHPNEIVYRGKESFCVVSDLSPGQEYQACVRAVNRIGPGLWSEALTLLSGAAPPLAPEAPSVIIKSATHLTVSWKEPITNGAPINEYRLESSVAGSCGSLSNSNSITDVASTANSNSTNSNNNNNLVRSTVAPEDFNVCYQGIHTTADIRNLIPFTIYYFRVNASNLAGTSPYSPIISTTTPASTPNAPEILEYEITAHEIKFNWSEPESNGSPIMHYVIEYGDKSIQTESNCLEYTITNLTPETSYRFKIQAVNGIGSGQYSNSIKLATLPPPPEPPKLECTGAGHNFIKLKWGEGRNIDFTTYYVEMYSNRAKEFQLVYSGTSFMCKVNKLQEQTAYTFRIYAGTDRAGMGDYSEEYIFKTTATVPSGIKPPRIVDANMNSSINTNSLNAIGTSPGPSISGNAINSSSLLSTAMFLPSSSIHSSHNNSHNANTNSCYIGQTITIEWQNSKNSFTDPVEYILQRSCNKESSYVEIYRGPETRFTVENLEPGTLYFFRVCPVRISLTNGDILGTFTTPLRYQVPHSRICPDLLDAATHHHHNHHATSSSSTNSLQQQQQHQQQHQHNIHHHHHQHHHHNQNHRNSSVSTYPGDVCHLCYDDLVKSGVAGASMTAVGGVNGGGGSGGNFLNNNNNNGNGIGGIGKLSSIYSNRKHLSDQEKAILWMFSFLVAAICFAVLVKMFMR